MTTSSKPSSLAGFSRLLLAIAGLAVVWLVILPLIGRQPVVSEHIQQQERLGIDPSAMFYTELEILPAIAHRVERLQLLNASSRDGEQTEN
ncbi:hypothetical protein [Anatilimnocola floriformis]|uniref:hypothetical protein n=1 Tax=Anatilimnocola floriformis TaxID=2948575 RepID=UPI0020C25D92|nr:hypothetical protein [Anatilimnocola floriformis]